MRITESFVHVAMREYLKKCGWLLIAGEYPNGSDDELNVLSISNPIVARDNSPDPRRHSAGEIIPDLIAYKNGVILIIEAKPDYSIEDKEKLNNLLCNKRSRLILSLEKFSTGKHQYSGIDYNNAIYVPVLAYGNPTYKVAYRDSGFGHIYVKTLNDAKLIFFDLPEIEVLV
ncbi:MAG: hypothetical protein NC081_03755 [Roseburia sp.]|nr:hypothetical protein [Roseburia sp.]